MQAHVTQVLIMPLIPQDHQWGQGKFVLFLVSSKTLVCTPVPDSPGFLGPNLALILGSATSWNGIGRGYF